jgi:transglutaminase-like putative cysteine protease
VISFPKRMKYNLIVFKLNIFQAPSSVEESMDTLANYLAKPAQNDLEKVRALYVWICENIRYCYRNIL